MTDVIIHIFPGTSSFSADAFRNAKEAGIDEFKNHLLLTLGHVGISFPDDGSSAIYGFGPNITQDKIIELFRDRVDYQKKRMGVVYRPKIPWTAANFLFADNSPEFEGIITNDINFFTLSEHIQINLVLVNKTKEQALEFLVSMNDKPYGGPWLKAENENCLTVIFNDQLKFLYKNNRNPVVFPDRHPRGMLNATLSVLNNGLVSNGGRRKRRKTRRRKTRRRKTRRRKKKRKRKTIRRRKK